METKYLKESVGKYLCKALCEVATRRPERPIEFLAYQLIALYEKDLEMQRTKQAASEKEDEESTEVILPVPEISQMFTERLSISISKKLEDISPALSSFSVSIGSDVTEEEKDLTELDENEKQKLIAEQAKPGESALLDDKVEVQRVRDLGSLYSLKKPSSTNLLKIRRNTSIDAEVEVQEPKDSASMHRIRKSSSIKELQTRKSLSIDNKAEVEGSKDSASMYNMKKSSSAQDMKTRKSASVDSNVEVQEVKVLESANNLKKPSTSNELKTKESALLNHEVEVLESSDLLNIYSTRKASTINAPVTEDEQKEFGTSDPFLARRNTKLFDVNFAPIGNNPDDLP